MKINAMSGEKSVTRRISDFLDNYSVDGFIDRLKNTDISVEDPSLIEMTIEKIRLQESQLRALRQQIEYQMRKHRLQEFRDRL